MESGGIERYYDASPQREWDRLEVLHDRIDFAVTLRALVEFLPRAPSAVLDIGGGPGRYAIALRSAGMR